jgi:glycerophosphoryl diester phosphodiesterase
LKIIAHRGFSGNYPENTLLAFEKALDTGADGIETDLQLSRDNVPVLFHDDTLKRITGVDKKPRELTLAELQSFDAGSWFDPAYHEQKIPSLDELLNLCKARAILILEIKYAPLSYQRLCEEIERRIHDKLDWVEVSCFEDCVLEYMHRLNPEIRLHKLVDTAQTLQQSDFETFYSYTDYFDIDIHLHPLVVQTGLMQRKKVIFWTLDIEEVDEEMKAGLYGIMSNTIL